MKADKPILYDATGKPLTNSYSRSFLREAVEKGDLKAVRCELSRGKLIDKSPSREKSLLEVAAERGHLAIVRELINAGTDLNRGFDYPPLYAAVLQGHTEIVRALISAGADINLLVDEDDDTALLEAIEQDNFEIVKLLVEAGANVNFWGEVGTPLLVALEGGHREIYDFLYQFVTDHEILRIADAKFCHFPATTESKFSFSEEQIEAFTHSAGEGHLSDFQSILQRGIDVDSKNSVGSTALIEAAYFGQISIVERLLKKDANPNLRGTNEDGTLGQAPLIAAVASDSPNRLKVIKKLIQAGADVNLKVANDFTALMYALYYGASEDREDVVRALIFAGADVNAIDASGTSILMHAQQNYLENVIHILQISGAWR